jgi:pimeloyl-ACP methyl ester carboxylesterase
VLWRRDPHAEHGRRRGFLLAAAPTHDATLYLRHRAQAGQNTRGLTRSDVWVRDGRKHSIDRKLSDRNRRKEIIMTPTPTTINRSSATWRRGRRLLRAIGRTLAALVGLIVVLGLVGAIYESAAEAADVRAYPPPGQLVDVGGYRLHINCTGEGSPTVVVESGWGDMSAIWGWVQPEVAKTTRICTYDRAGMGWSEASREPRVAREYAKELHTLLANANERGPYVLVGHSMGGFTVLVYAHDYPADVLGLVLVDSQDVPASDGAAPMPAPKPSENSVTTLLARIGLMRLLAAPLGAIENLPEGVKQAYTAFTVAPRGVQAFTNEGMGMSEGGAQARAVTTLGALPLIVLSRGKDQDAKHTAAQTSLLQLSTDSQQFFAEQSGHRIMIDQPEAAIAAIVKMVEQVRRQPMP